MSSTGGRRRRWILGVALLGLAAVGALPLLRAVLWRWEANPVLRGRRVAESSGCFACHRPEAGGEIPNPDSRWGTVPAFGAGNARMYLETRAEIEEIVRYGAPLAWLEDAAVRSRLERQRLRMPAYEGRLADGEIDDLVAWVAAVERVELPGGEAAAAGRAVAREHGCLACHGIEGGGGVANPGSLGGFVPGFLGGNYDDLVTDRAEFEEWVRTGRSSRLEENPVIAWFWRRQAVSMPAYGEALADEEIDALWTWIEGARRSYE